MLGVSRLLTGRVTEGDALRYERHSGRLPAPLLHYSADKKPVVVWTSTRRCNLHCAHCYSDSHDREYPGELSTDEAVRMVHDLAAFGAPVLLISGGEPLRRPDIEVVAEAAVRAGMRVVISTNGTLLTAERAQRLAGIGVSYVGISIDGRPHTHDRFRGMAGAFEASMRGIEACQAHGITCGFRFTVTRANQQDLPWLFDLMVERDVHRLCVYHLAPTGRGARIGKFAPAAEETRAALDLIFSDHFSRHEPGVFEPLRETLLTRGDHYMHLADLTGYLEADRRLCALYADPEGWTRTAILNVASSGPSSSDRTIAEYAADIWDVAPCPVP